ncbi:Oncosphere antigen A [Taenia solium]|eukprot:TsM_001105300 transcript=TsM_001105300 gene=TsM_001105300
MQLHANKVAVNVEPSSVFGVHRLVTVEVWKGEVTVDELDAYTLYKVTVEATGNGVHLVYTMQPTQTWPTAPSRIPPPTGRGISRTQIEVEWKPPSSVRGVLQSYQVTCSEGVTSGNKISVSTEDNKTTSIQIPGLRKSKGYVCVVAASTVPADGQDPKECVRESDPSSPIRTLDTAMRKPKFDAIYREDIEVLDLVMHEPEGVEGIFDGFEVFLKTGGTQSKDPWRSVADIRPEERECELEGVETLATYAVTVRGRVLPLGYSEIADVLEFETMDADLSVPRDVTLNAVDPYTVRMTWRPPKQTYGLLIGYFMEWRLKDMWYEMDLPPSDSYDFTNLGPGDAVTVSLCAHSRPNTAVKFDYFGHLSEFVEVTIPLHKQGMRKPTFEATYFGDTRDLHIVLHEPEGVIGDFGGFKILKKMGPPDSPTPWDTVASLTAKEREYQMEKLHPLLMYSITVCGLTKPNILSRMAVPLVFEIVHEDDSVPQNVNLQVVDSCRVQMTWEPPIEPYGFISYYSIEWNLNEIWQDKIHISPGRAHTFSKVKSGQTISAAVRAHVKMQTSVKFEYVTPHSRFQTMVIPPLKEC